MTEAAGGRAHPEAHDNSVIETLQSLIVAFVLAMTFRGFVTEGFVIPTGSMAPTLLGRHKLLHSRQTGWEFAAGADPRRSQLSPDEAPDPILGPRYTGSGQFSRGSRARMGDRILVMKALYQFSDPSRFDVVVFKNPTNPNGEDGNYIKRLIGLPGEAIWLVDGDVFAGSAEHPDDYERYVIQRKPEYVQRAVWQPVNDTDYPPTRPENLDVPYRGSPWQGDDKWTLDGTTFRCSATGESSLEWDSHLREVNDWAPYNILAQRIPRDVWPVNDLRVTASVVPAREGLRAVFSLTARGQNMEFIVSPESAEVRMRSSEYGDEYPNEGWVGSGPQPIDPMPAGRPTDIEVWHVDQSLSIFVNDERVAYYEYDWRPPERLSLSTGHTGDVRDLARDRAASGPYFKWTFDGGPLDISRMRVDRDLYYRTDRLNENTRKNPTNPGFEDRVRARQYAFGTHPDNLAILGPDHFFMCGDNSTASSDSRLWGNPHPLVATQIDPSPFVVNRKLMLGKAWVVYFPAPHAVSENGRAFIPDFGRLRFIR